MPRHATLSKQRERVYGDARLPSAAQPRLTSPSTPRPALPPFHGVYGILSAEKHPPRQVHSPLPAIGATTIDKSRRNGRGGEGDSEGFWISHQCRRASTLGAVAPWPWPWPWPLPFPPFPRPLSIVFWPSRWRQLHSRRVSLGPCPAAPPHALRRRITCVRAGNEGMSCSARPALPCPALHGPARPCTARP